MGDHTRKFFHISLSQENKFSFEGESGHFKSHIMSKNALFSKRAVPTSGTSNFFKVEKIAMCGFTCYIMPSPDHF